MSIMKKHTKEFQMTKGNKYLKPILGAVIAVTLLIGQGGGYLSQKLMVENNIRSRVKEALSKIIDSHKYVINVDVELEIIDEVNEQITLMAQRESKNKRTKSQTSQAEATLSRLQEKMLEEQASDESQYSVGLPIPGFEVDVTKQQGVQRQESSTRFVEPSAIEESVEPETDEEGREIVDKVLSRKRPSRAEISKMDLTLILQEGAAPELIENIRQLTMAAAKFDRERGDKLTIMTASFKERRDAKSAEQIMLKNIAEKIDLMEQKRVAENTDWRDEIQKYRNEEKSRREEDKKFFQNQLTQMEEKAKAQAFAQEKKEMLRRDSLKVAKLNNEISALKEMLTLSQEEGNSQQSKVDSSRFAMLDNELQGLRRMLLQAMLKDSIDAQKQAQAKIEAEIASRESEKAKRDSLIEEKISALEEVQSELDAIQAERSEGLGTNQILLIAFGSLALILLVALVFVMSKSRQQAPIPPWMYPPPRPRKKKKKAKKKKASKKEETKEDAPAEPEPEPTIEAAVPEVETQPRKTGDDPNVIKSEIDDIRKSVVSMSVGQPSRTSTIVKEWLEQPAPTPPEPEPSDDEGDED